MDTSAPHTLLDLPSLPTTPLDRIVHELDQLRTEFEQQVLLATHDPLTGLPNRRTILSRLSQWSAQATQTKAVAVLFFDVDRFKLINDLYGHEVGDRTLVQVADRLRDATSSGEDLARLGGDEFVVISRDATTRGLDDLVGRVRQTLSGEVDVGHRLLPLSVSIGVAVATSSTAAQELLSEADAAMYRAKAGGRGTTVFFDDDMHREHAERSQLERELSAALQDGQLTVHYQPTYDLRSGRITGCDALVRWLHPDRGVLPAHRFVPLAEAVGEVWAIDTFVLGETIRQVATWQAMDPGLGDLTVAVNLSGQLLRDANLVTLLDDLLGSAGVAPSTFQLDISESTVMDDRNGTPGATLQELADLGVRLGVDNFGTAASPLTTLKQLPVGVINIDRSFTAGAGTTADDNAILRAILGLADAFGIDAVADGIETARQLDWLQDAGCLSGRGYYLSRPVPAAHATQLLLRG